MKNNDSLLKDKRFMSYRSKVDLKELRKSSGLLAKDFAQKINCSYLLWRQYESGLRNPSYDFLVRASLLSELNFLSKKPFNRELLILEYISYSILKGLPKEYIVTILEEKKEVIFNKDKKKLFKLKLV